jgi:hypothetical protein
VARWPQRYREINHNTCYRCYFLDFEQHIAPGMEAIYDDMPIRAARRLDAILCFGCLLDQIVLAAWFV